MAETGFVREAHRGIIIMGETLEGLLDKTAEFRPHRTIVQMKVSDL